MKKIIRILSLILLITLISVALVITISNADSTGARPYLDHSKPTLKVTKDTTAKQMIDALTKEGKNLTNITVKVKDENKYLYCRQRGVNLWDGTAVYQLVPNKEPEIYPGIDKNGNGKIDKTELTDSKGFAKAYILATDDYIKNDNDHNKTDRNDEKQYAWWYSLGQITDKTPNNLYDVAMAYQEYKEAESKLDKVQVVDEDEDKDTEQIGNEYVYGPIKIKYAYKEGTSAYGSKKDEWGGFSYIFLDENDKNINEKVYLCTSESSGSKIRSTEESGGYRKIKETGYNNTPLYIVTNDKSVGTVNLKIKTTKVDYTATVYFLEGEKKVASSYQELCDTCSVRLHNAQYYTGIGGVIEDLDRNSKTEGYYTYFYDKENGCLYTVTRITDSKDVFDGSSPGHVYIKDGNTKSAMNYCEYGPGFDDIYKCSYCGETKTTKGCPHYQGTHYCGKHNNGFICSVCHYLLCGNDTGSNLHMNGGNGKGSCFLGDNADYHVYMNHFENNHYSTGRRYYQNVYTFELGCSSCGNIKNAGNYGSQALTLVDPEKTEIEIKDEITIIPIKFGMSIPVEKTWNDDGNRDGIRPESVKVTLKDANGKTVTTGVGGQKVTNPIILTEKDGWKGEFTGLDRQAFDNGSITYTIEEEVPEGYTVESITPSKISKKQGDPEVGFKITNKHEPERIKVTIKKEWDDDDNRDAIRPESVKVKLWISNNNEWVNVEDWFDENGNRVNVPEIITLEEKNGWTFTTGELYKYYSEGKIRKFKIEEITVPEGYKNPPSYDPPSNDSPSKAQNPETCNYTYIVENIHDPETIIIPVTKVWDDESDRDGIRPSRVTLKLIDEDGKVVDTLTIKEEDNSGDIWTGQFPSSSDVKIYKYKKGQVGVLKEYRIEEESLNSYQDYDTNKLFGYAEPKYTTSSTSQENPSTTCGSIKGNANYKAHLENNVPETLSGFTVINTHVPEKVKIIIKKDWQDDNNRDNVRAEDITFTLKADGVIVKKDAYNNSVGDNPVILNDENGWTYTYENLCRYKDHGVEIEYTVEENATPQYYIQETMKTEKVFDTSTGIQTITLSITNRHELELVEFEVTKIWDDDTDRDGLRPGSIILDLYADGEVVDTLEIKGSKDEKTWKGKFPSSDKVKLYKYKEGSVGVLLKYTIQERTIQNKQPYDENQRYDAAQYTASSKSQENATTDWQNIYISGTTSYHDSVNNNKPQTLSGFTIINKHIPEKVKIVIKKIWDDDNNRDDVRAKEVIFTLESNENTRETVKVEKDADGNPITNPATLNQGNEWTYTYENLFRYKNHGEEIIYKIIEENTPDYYTQQEMKTTKEYDKSKGYETITLSITNRHELELVEFEVTKIWDDDNDRDGLRPESIILDLYADGAKVDSITIDGTNTENQWGGQFPSSEDIKLYKYKKGSVGVLIKYTIQEQTIPNKQEYDETQRYDDPKYTTSKSSGNTSSASTTCGSISGTKNYHDSVNDYKPEILSGFTVINHHSPELMKVTVTKVWDDVNDLDEYRPDSITCKLLSNETGTVAKYAAAQNGGTRKNVENITITDPIKSGGEYSDTWGAVTVENLYRYYNHGTAIEYTVQENSIDHYNEKDTHGNNKVRPESRIYYNGTGANAANPKVEIVDCDYRGGTPVANKVVEITITNKHTPYYDGYIEITGKVWEDLPDGKANDINGIFDEDEKGLAGITVILRDKNGDYFDDKDSSVTTTKQDGSYTLKVNYDPTTNVYKLHDEPSTAEDRLKDAYVEFIYDGMTYTTVKDKVEKKTIWRDGTATEVDAQSRDQSKAKEDETWRQKFDREHSTVTPTTPHPDDWEDKKVSATTEDVINFANYFDRTKTESADKRDDKESTEVIRYCTGNSYQHTNPDGAWLGDPQTGEKYLTSDKYMADTKHPDQTSCNHTGYDMSTYKVKVQEIQYVNLGLFKREQPDIAIFSELSKVTVRMNSQEYTYLYDSKTEVTKEKAQNAWQEAYDKKYAEVIADGMSEAEADRYARQYAEQKKIQVQFENKDVYTYRRPINPADISYVKNLNTERILNVFVTYKVRVANTSSTLKMTVHNIINSYDLGYTIISPGWTNTKTDEVARQDKFNEAKYDGDLNIQIDPLKEKEIEITYSVNFDTIKSLLRQEATLNNVVEIESFSTAYGANTLYAEQRTGGRTGNHYAGYDYDSKPGNANIEFKTANEIKIALENAGKEYNEAGKDRLYSYQEATPKGLEDDTDIAPSFTLLQDEEKFLSGNVWEDSDHNTSDNERIGDGNKDRDEKNLANAKVELYKVKDDGTTELAKLYYSNGSDPTPAVTYSNNDGYYKFGENGSCGVVTDTYIIKFTYGKGIDGTRISSIDGLEVDARNYKSTIIALGDQESADQAKKQENDRLYNLFKNENAEDDQWHLKTKKGYSIAVDDIQERTKIDDLQYSNFENGIYMTAYSKLFRMQVEFDPNVEKTSAVGPDGEAGFGKELNIFDFGIIERAREDIFVEKTIDYVKVTLANGQVLIEGNPKDSLNYVKAVGFYQTYNTGLEARKGLAKRMVIEMDPELIQQAQLNMRYLIKVTNNSEMDFDYYLGEDTEPFDPTKVRKEYYYFGTNTQDQSPIIRGAVNKLIDYIDTDYNFNWEYSTNWTEINNTADLNGLICNETKNLINNNKYKAYTTTMFSEIGPGESKSDYAFASKLLANKDQNKFENHIEILQIDEKSARTIGEDEHGNSIFKQYKPGDYVPSTSRREVIEYENHDDYLNNEREGVHQQDDDVVEIVITPPTGLTENIIKYSLIGLVVMAGVSLGVIFIKKKVLTK